MSHPDQHSQSLLLQPAPPELQRHLLACVTVLDAHGWACFLYKASVLLAAALSPAHMCKHAFGGVVPPLRQGRQGHALMYIVA